jgi:hypothetical protein
MASGRASCGLLRMLTMAKPVRGITGQSKSLFGAPCLAHGLGGCTVCSQRRGKCQCQTVQRASASPASNEPREVFDRRPRATSTSTRPLSVSQSLVGEDVQSCILSLCPSFDVDLRYTSLTRNKHDPRRGAQHLNPTRHDPIRQISRTATSFHRV